jgi:hypothetical protein
MRHPCSFYCKKKLQSYHVTVLVLLLTRCHFAIQLIIIKGEWRHTPPMRDLSTQKYPLSFLATNRTDTLKRCLLSSFDVEDGRLSSRSLGICSIVPFECVEYDHKRWLVKWIGVSESVAHIHMHYVVVDHLDEKMFHSMPSSMLEMQHKLDACERETLNLQLRNYN